MAHETIGQSQAEWAGKTYTEIREIAAEDGSIVVVPIGSLEQHGYHMPVVTDTLLVDAVSTLGAERASEAGVPVLVTPTEWVGHSPHHMSLGGTITADFDTLLDLLEDVVDAALDNGFDAAMIVNGHGGNRPLIASAVRTIGPRYPDAEILSASYFELAGGFIDDIRDSGRGGTGHAGELETSLMLHLRPDLVGDDRQASTWDGDLFDEESDPVDRYSDVADRSDSGALGAPELASAEKGAAVYDGLGDELAGRLEEIHERNA